MRIHIVIAGIVSAIISGILYYVMDAMGNNTDFGPAGTFKWFFVILLVLSIVIVIIGIFKN